MNPAELVKQLIDGTYGNNVQELIDDVNVSDKQRSEFFRILKEDSKVKFNLIRKDKNSEDFKHIRNSLGLWYSAMIFADLLSYDPKAPPHTRLQSRLQAVLHEALAWFPNAIFGQVILHFRGDKEPAQECIGLVDIDEKKFNELKGGFRDKIKEYVKKNGSTVELDVHLRFGSRWTSNPKTDKPSKGISSVKHTFPGMICTSEIAALDSRTQEIDDEQTFIETVAKKYLVDQNIIKKDTSLGLLHIASGLDVVFENPRKVDYSTVAHLYVLCEVKNEKVEIDTIYEHTMQTLLSKLANFYATQKYLEEQQKYLEERAMLRKHSQMLELLQGPLESITTMLNKSQEDAQTLRALLYDPHRSIFAAAPRVMKYFEQYREISFGSVKWKAPHNAGDGDKETLANTIAATVCEIFGKTEITPANNQELYGIANGLLNSNEKAFEELRELFTKVVEFNEIPINDKNKLKAAFSKLKAILFTSYKDGTEDFPLLPLLVVFYDFNDESTVRYKSLIREPVKDALSNNALIDINIFNGLKLPVPRYSALLAFLSGVLAYVKSEGAGHDKSSTGDKSKSKALSATINANSIQIEFNSNVFVLSKLKDSLEPLQDIIEKNIRPLYVGNFQKPFIDFAGMCVKGGRQGIACVESSEYWICGI